MWIRTLMIACSDPKPPPGDSGTATWSNADVDMDGFVDANAGGEDCDDNNAAVHPDAPEVCDDTHTDDDCDGLVNEADPSVMDAHLYYTDADRDGFGDANDPGELACAPSATRVLDSTDCNDGDDSVHPLATEVCDPGDVDGLPTPRRPSTATTATIRSTQARPRSATTRTSTRTAMAWPTISTPPQTATELRCGRTRTKTARPTQLQPGDVPPRAPVGGWPAGWCDTGAGVIAAAHATSPDRLDDRGPR